MAHHQPVTKRASLPRCRHADIPAVPARPEPALPATRVTIPRRPVTQPRSSGLTGGAPSCTSTPVGFRSSWQMTATPPADLQNSHQNGGCVFLIFVADPRTGRLYRSSIRNDVAIPTAIPVTRATDHAPRPRCAQRIIRKVPVTEAAGPSVAYRITSSSDGITTVRWLRCRGAS
jgi:hypothetical protein